MRIFYYLHCSFNFTFHLRVLKKNKCIHAHGHTRVLCNKICWLSVKLNRKRVFARGIAAFFPHFKFHRFPKARVSILSLLLYTHPFFCHLFVCLSFTLWFWLVHNNWALLTKLHGILFDSDGALMKVNMSASVCIHFV